MEALREKLKGKKTYIMAIVSIIGTVAAYFVGDINLSDASQLILTAILGITVRNGITAETKK